MDGIKKILIMEPDPMVNKMIIRHLKRKGFVLVQAQNAEEAIDAVQCAGKDDGGFDLVIANFFDPHGEGMMLFRWLKKKHPTIPLLIISDYGTMDMTMEILRDDIDGFCRMPLTPKDVLAAVAVINVRQKLSLRSKRVAKTGTVYIGD